MIDSGIARCTGTVGEIHALDPFSEWSISRVTALWCDFTTPAIVLGSRQSPDLLDLEACRRAGLSIVQRRSGGGSVVLRPAETIWIDLVVPIATAWVSDDVRASMIWAGECWRTALQPLVDGELSVHAGGMVTSAWSDLVCFAGLGPGEVLLDGKKLVGLSQRRTRAGLRIQGLVYHRQPRPADRDLFLGPRPDDGAPLVATLGSVCTADHVCARLATAAG